MALPGAIDDSYSVTFNITPPALHELALHKDWVDAYGAAFMKRQQFHYKNVDFEAIAKASRR